MEEITEYLKAQSKSRKSAEEFTEFINETIDQENKLTEKFQLSNKEGDFVNLLITYFKDYSKKMLDSFSQPELDIIEEQFKQKKDSCKGSKIISIDFDYYIQQKISFNELTAQLLYILDATLFEDNISKGLYLKSITDIYTETSNSLIEILNSRSF